MKNHIFTLGIVGALLASCAINEIDVADPIRNIEFHATIEEASTKVFADDKLRVLWNADDRVSIFNKYTYNQEYRFTGKDGDNAGSFKIVSSDDFVTGNSLDYVYSVYPYQESTSIDNDGIITLTLPAEQLYRENSFGPEANTMISATENNQLMYKNLCGYLSVKLYGDEVAVSSISLKGNNNEPLAGEATVTSSVGNAPSMLFTSAATDEITLTFEEPITLGTTADDATSFWFVVPPTTFSKGFTLTVKDDKNAVFEKATSKCIEISRSKLARMNSLKTEFPASTPDSDDFSSQYLTFEILSDGSISWVSKYNGGTMPKTIEYSLNGGSWTEITSTRDGTSVSVKKGDLLRFRGDNESYGVLEIINSQNRPWYNYFSSSCQFMVYGNIMSLINSTNFMDLTSFNDSCAFFGLFRGCDNLVDASHLVLPALTLTERCYWNMFMDCTSLVSAPDLPATTLDDYCYSGMFSGCKSLQTSPDLPATTLASHCYERMFFNCSNLVTISDLPATTLADYCYSIMFYGCTGLLKTPSLPATDLADYCYNEMFQDCTNLKTAANLPATTLAAYCYFQMFMNCTSLTIAPELPARVLADHCYQNMFYGCTGLEYVKCLATDISASLCTSNWLYHVSSSGVFVKAISMNSWSIGVSGIPIGWTIETTDADNYEAIDLGLPSGLKWASFNLGASKPEEFGDYYAWGETEPYYEPGFALSDSPVWKPGKEAGYDWPTYKWCMGSGNTLTKYCSDSSYGYNGFTDNKTALDLEDDAACISLGGKWRMPTNVEWTELWNNCTWIWTTQNGVNGRLVTGPNGNSIFLPAAGSWNGINLFNAGFCGSYLSSSLNISPGSPFDAWYFFFNYSHITGDRSRLPNGHSIRPVSD